MESLLLCSIPASLLCMVLLHFTIHYMFMVGALQYVTLTKPDIGFSVNKVCQFMASPSESHWSAVKRILHYISGTISHGLLLAPTSLPKNFPFGHIVILIGPMILMIVDQPQALAYFCVSKSCFMELQEATYGCKIEH